MKRTEILSIASKYVNHDKNTEHGDAESEFHRIADMWSAYLNGSTAIEAHDVAAMMVILKICRIRVRPGNMDSWIDVCGYSSIGGEISPSTTPKDGEIVWGPE